MAKITSASGYLSVLVQPFKIFQPGGSQVLGTARTSPTTMRTWQCAIWQKIMAEVKDTMLA